MKGDGECFPLDLLPLSLGICNPRGVDCGYVIRAGRETRNHSPLWIRRSTRTSLEINFFVIGINFFVLGDLQSPRQSLRIYYPRGSGDPQLFLLVDPEIHKDKFGNHFFCYWNQFLCPWGFAIPEAVIADMLSARVGRPAIIPPLWIRRSTRTSLEINFFVIGINFFVLGDLQSPRQSLRIYYPRGSGDPQLFLLVDPEIHKDSLEINFFVIGINFFVLGDLQSPRC